MSDELAVRENETALVVSEAELAALQQQQEDEIDDVGLFQTPILKIGQPLTKEVQAEEAEAGEFINTLTGDVLGNKVEFVVADYQRGRFAADRDSGRVYTAYGDTIPPTWSDLVGDSFVGTPFAEYPDAEETYKQRVNAKEIEWGKGPLVSTTHNFTGLVITPKVDESGEETGENEICPVRLSLQRSNMPAVRKILTLKKASLRGRSFWDKVFDLSTEKKPFDRGTAFVLTARLGRDSTPEERQEAVQLFMAVRQGRVVDNAEQAERAAAPVEPDAKGGVAL